MSMKRSQPRGNMPLSSSMIAGAGVLILAVTIAKPADSQSRFGVGPVFRSEYVSVEGGGGGWVPVTGVAGTIRITETFGVVADWTRASSRFERSYEGWFVSFAEEPEATPEEIVRLAPTARRTLGYVPGIGGSVALTVRHAMSSRLGVIFRVGGAGRAYHETSTFTVLEIPEDVDSDRIASSRAFKDESYSKIRGGFLFGLDVPIAVSHRFSLAPEIRFVYGGPARIGNTYRAFGVGLRGSFDF